MWWQDIEKLKLISSALSPIVGALLVAGLAWWAFTRQLRRNSRMQVYLEVIPALYEAQRLVFLRLQSHVNKEGLSAAEQEEVSKGITSLLGRIGKLHLAASPKTMKAVNDFCSVLSEIYDGHFPNPAQPHIFRKMKATDVSAQVERFETALIRLLASMRKDLGYKMRSLQIVHSSFTSSFLRDRREESKAMGAGGDTGSGMTKN